MKEVRQISTLSDTEERMKLALKKGTVWGIGISLLNNHAIVWAVFNGDNSNINELLMETYWLIPGGIIGYFLIYSFRSCFKNSNNLM